MLKNVLKAVTERVWATWLRLSLRMGIARDCEATIQPLKMSSSQQAAAPSQIPTAAPTTAGTRIAVYRRHPASAFHRSPERQMVGSVFRLNERRIWWTHPERVVRTDNATFSVRSSAAGAVRQYSGLPYAYAPPFRCRKLCTREHILHERFVRRIFALREAGLTAQEIAMLLNCRTTDGAQRF